MKLSAVLLFCTLWSLLVYAPVCHWVWGGGWLAQAGVVDFAGGIVVHVTAGVGALLTCAMLGPRAQNEMKPHSLPMAVTGAGMLWVGWFGFNGGSAGAASALAASACVLTQLSAAAAALVWFALDARERKPTSLGLITGAIAGLAAITPAAGVVGPAGAVVIGALSALVCRFFSTAVKNHFRYDDSLDVFGVHGVGGVVGSLALAPLGAAALGGSSAVPAAQQLAAQALGVGATALYTLIVSFALLKLTGALTGGLRVTAAEEAAGLDGSELGEEAYLTA